MNARPSSSSFVGIFCANPARGTLVGRCSSIVGMNAHGVFPVTPNEVCLSENINVYLINFTSLLYRDRSLLSLELLKKPNGARLVGAGAGPGEVDG